MHIRLSITAIGSFDLSSHTVISLIRFFQSRNQKSSCGLMAGPRWPICFPLVRFNFCGSPVG